jgi:RimJ/RimL family protein N-acetyltransferase
MTAPHETPIPGPAADFALALNAHLPVLETPRLRLRAPALGDFEHWAEILCGPAGPHLGGPFGRDDAFTEFAAACGGWLLRGHGVWTVEAKAGGAVLGFVLIGFEPGDLEPELGYLFRKMAEGQGFATEAAAAARDHARSSGLPSLVSYVAPANARSARVAEGLGAVQAGTVDGSDVWRYWPRAIATATKEAV